jgi:nucleoside-diphosphate-sugar epimerase
VPTDLNNRVFVAGAGGAIGRPLCRLLVDDGWAVVGTTRSPGRAAVLQEMGVIPVIVDVFDEGALRRVVAESGADVIIHQLTDLPPGLDPTKMAVARIRNARVREVGTRNLLLAAATGGVKRMVAQSIAFAYAPGPMPYHEDWPLNVADDDDANALTTRAVASLEQQVLGAPLLGIVLRYGRLYGPGTGFENPSRGGPLHVDAAADAARRAITRGMPGVYNVAENDGTLSTLKAERELGWRSNFRIDSPGG